MRVVIVGGGAGGASCAARLRRLDDKAEIIILEKTKENSIANCAIPYYIGDVVKDKKDMQAISKDAFLKMFNVDVRLNKEVIEINPKKKTVTTTDEETISYDKLVLSVGLTPMIPEISGLELIPHFPVKTLKDANDIKRFIEKKKPKSVAVLGGGFIGIEMAENLHNLGLKTSIIDAAQQILPPVDVDIVYGLQKHIKEKGINLVLGHGVKEITDGGVVMASGEFVVADMIILSLGMYADIEMVKNAKIETLDNSVLVNEYMQTNFEDIYACGDSVAVLDIVSGNYKRMGLAGPANRQGRLIADCIAGEKYPYKGSQGTGIVKVFDMSVAFCGNNEKQLRDEKIEYDKMIVVGSSHAGYYPNSEQINMKVLYDEDGRILGAQAVGKTGIDKRIDIIASIMRLNGTVEDLRDAELCYAPPYSGAKDIINLMGMAIQNARQNLVRPYFDNSFDGFFVVDVRPKEIYNQGHIPFALNIPFIDLKSRLSEIPKDARILVHCTIGRTSYMASRILLANGFKEVYSYAGGWRQYLWQEQNPLIAA
ncbi:MAG: FAD-dependent oxidoreductase [Alphaproteobacteria bacterium]